jgi:uncharacterized protein YuzE
MVNQARLHFDPDADDLYIGVVEGEIADSRETQQGASGQIIGIEILNVSQRSPGFPASHGDLAKPANYYPARLATTAVSIGYSESMGGPLLRHLRR